MAIDEVEDKNWLTVSLSSVQRQANEVLGRDLNEKELKDFRGQLDAALDVIFDDMEDIMFDMEEEEEEE